MDYRHKPPRRGVNFGRRSGVNIQRRLTVGRFTDPWGDLVNYFRDVNITQVKFRLVSDAVNQQAQADLPNKA
jgi:hypothetical protein